MTYHDLDASLPGVPYGSRHSHRLGKVVHESSKSNALYPTRNHQSHYRHGYDYAASVQFLS